MWDSSADVLCHICLLPLRRFTPWVSHILLPRLVGTSLECVRLFVYNLYIHLRT